MAAGANGNSIVNVIRDLGQNVALVTSPGYSRTISVSPGRSFAGKTKDYGFSGQVEYNFGDVKLTSITAYRDYKSDQGSDTDYSTVDILYRAANGGASRQFRTFTQELRLQGQAFDNKLDWLIGGFYADEKLTVTDNLRFGNQYGRFATCRLISGGALAGLYSPTSAGCLAARPAAFGAASPIIYAAIDRLDAINDKGSTLDVYKQASENYAFFTHNIIHLTDRFDVTLGARYTNERKTLNATFGNDNVNCAANQAALSGFLTNPALAAVAGGIIGLSCQGNSTSELNGVSISDKRKEDKWTGTAIVSWKPIDHLLLYGSYSKGYKAGGFKSRPFGAQVPDSDVCVGWRRAGAGWQFAVRARNRRCLRNRCEVCNGPILAERGDLPSGVQKLPAQHVRRYRLYRTEYQRLLVEPCRW